MIDRNRLPTQLKEPLELVISTSDPVIKVKEMIEAKLDKILPAQFEIRLLELRVGERLSMPNNAKLSSFLINSKYAASFAKSTN